MVTHFVDRSDATRDTTKKANLGSSEHSEYLSEFLLGWFGQHLQLPRPHNIASGRNVKGSWVSSTGVPPQELAIFGRTVLEDVNETCLPPLQYRQLSRVMRRGTAGFGDTDVHHGEVFRLSQAF